MKQRINRNRILRGIAAVVLVLIILLAPWSGSPFQLKNAFAANQDYTLTVDLGDYDIWDTTGKLNTFSVSIGGTTYTYDADDASSTTFTVSGNTLSATYNLDEDALDTIPVSISATSTVTYRPFPYVTGSHLVFEENTGNAGDDRTSTFGVHYVDSGVQRDAYVSDFLNGGNEISIAMNYEDITEGPIIPATLTNTVATPSSALWEATTGFYKPAEVETYTIAFTSIDPAHYGIPEVKVYVEDPVSHETVEDTSLVSVSGSTVTATIPSNAVRIEAVSLGVDAPVGTFAHALANPTTDAGKYANGYYKGGTNIAATFTPTDPSLYTGSTPTCSLQYVIADATATTDEIAALTTWASPASFDETEGVFTLSSTISSNTDASKVIAIRNRQGTLVSGPVVFSSTGQIINIDATNPTVTITPTDGTSMWINASTNSTFAFRFTVTDAGSGPGKLIHRLHSDTDIVLNASGTSSTYTFSVPYSIDQKCSDFMYRVEDAVGNGLVSYDVYHASGILFDLHAPTITAVYKLKSEYDAQGLAAPNLSSADLARWHSEDLVAVIDVVDPEATGDETCSTLAENTVSIRYGGAAVTPLSATAITQGKEYVVVLNSDGEKNLTVDASDVAGNTATQYSKTLRIDKTGLGEISVKLSSTNTYEDDQAQFVSPFYVQASVAGTSGASRFVFDFYDKNNHPLYSQTVTSFEDTGTTQIAKLPVPAGAFSDVEGYVVVTCYDMTGSEEAGHKRVASPKNFALSGRGAQITMVGNEAWTNQDASVNITVSSAVLDIDTIEIWVDGRQVDTINPSNKRLHTLTHTVTADSEIDGTEVTVIAYAGPASNRVKTQASKILRVDKTAPNITLTGATEGGLYNSNRGINVVTSENVYPGLETKVTATRTIDGATTEMDLGSIALSSAVTAVTKEITEDGIYTITATVRDAAGNTDTKQLSFTLDKTAPVIQISGASEGEYASRAVNLNVQVTESFYENDRVTVTIERNLDGNKTERTLPFSSTGKVSNLIQMISEDGDYTVTVTAVDGAGNAATTQTLKFTVDVTAPEVTLTGTKDYFVTSGAVNLNFTVIENYYQTNVVKINVSRRLANGKMEIVVPPTWVNTSRTSSITDQYTQDGYYTVRLEAVDRAGNKKQAEMHFTIDTQAPVIDDAKLQEYNGKYLKGFVFDMDLDEMITELTLPTIGLTLNGVAYDGSAITEDGKYTLVLKVEDEVGLSSTSTIEFVIDNTPPKVIFSGAEDGKRYTDNVHLNVALENDKDHIDKIEINGENYELTPGEVSYDIDFTTMGSYTVTVDTSDAAGNINIQTISFDYAERGNRIWLLVLCGASVCACVGLVGFLLIRKRTA